MQTVVRENLCHKSEPVLVSDSSFRISMLSYLRRTAWAAFIDQKHTKSEQTIKSKQNVARTNLRCCDIGILNRLSTTEQNNLHPINPEQPPGGQNPPSDHHPCPTDQLRQRSVIIFFQATRIRKRLVWSCTSFTL